MSPSPSPRPGSPAPNVHVRWDRGTLLLDGPAERVRELPGALWDPRVRRYRAPAHGYRQLVDCLGPLDLVESRRRRRPAPPLRTYQQQAVDAWATAGQRGLLALPTGAGKTRTAIAAIARTGLPTLCIVPTRVLLAQWRRSLLGAGLGPVGQLGDGVRDLQHVTVATTASARWHAARLGPRFALLVVDEAHHHAASDETLELYPAPARLGLTATPPEDPDAMARLEALLGPVVYRIGVDELTGTFLSTFDTVRWVLDLGPDAAAAYARDMARFRTVYASWARTNPGGRWQAFMAAAMRSVEGRKGVAAWRRARRRLAWPRCKSRAVGELLQRHAASRMLLFAADNTTAYALAREHLVAPITCDIGKAERAELLQAFAEGRLRRLVSARVLNEGLDVPDADVAVLCGGSQGSREYVQRVGRVLRPAEGKRALVVELAVRNTHETRQLERGRRRLASP